MRPWIWPWCVWAAYTLRFVVSVEHMAFQARELEAACEAVCTVQCSTSSLARWKLKAVCLRTEQAQLYNGTGVRSQEKNEGGKTGSRYKTGLAGPEPCDEAQRQRSGKRGVYRASGLSGESCSAFR